MDRKLLHSFGLQILIFLGVDLILSAAPLSLAFLAPGSMARALVTSWYGLIPPVLLFFLGWWFYRRERNCVLFMGRIWLGVGLWFGFQWLLRSLPAKSLVLMLLTLPSVYAGDYGYTTGTLLFLLGAAGFTVWGIFEAARRPAHTTVNPSRGRWFVALGLIAAFVGLPAFALYASASAAPARPQSAPPLPTSNEIFGNISKVYSFGVRRPGTPEHKAAADYLVSQFKQLGLQNVQVETTTFDLWEAKKWSVAVDEGQGLREIENFYVPYSRPTGPGGMTGDIVYVGNGDAAALQGKDLKGKIALVDLPAVNISWTQFNIFGNIGNDPGQTAKDWSRPFPIGWGQHMVSVYPALEAAGATGVIGIMQNYPKMGPLSYYAPYDGELRSIPGFYIRDDEGNKLKQALQTGQVKARLTLDAAVSKDGGQAPLIYGVLPGKSTSTIMLHSHYDSPWASGVEDSSGTGMILSLARYFAAVPADQRERTLVFVLTGSHMVGARSNQPFYAKHKTDILSHALFDVAIEHIADDYPFDTQNPTVRGVFVSENPTVTSIFSRSVVAGGLGRTLVLPTGSPLGVPTDANPFMKAGMNIVSFISGPVYLIDNADTLDRVFQPDLAKVASAYIDFIGRMNERPDFLFQFRVNGLAIGVLLLLFTPLGFGWYLATHEEPKSR